jgi:ATP-dependent RNA helicase DHX36
LLTRRDVDRELLKQIKQEFSVATQLLLIKKHHVSYTGHGPPHKRVFSCELRMQVPEAWKDLGLIGGADTRADDTWVDAALAFAARNAEARGVPCPARVAEGSGKEKGQSVLELVAGGLDFSKNDAQRLAIHDLFDAVRLVTGNEIDPKTPMNVGRMVKDQKKASLKRGADEGRLLLELVNGSRPSATYAPKGAGWAATVTAYVDGGKSLTATGVGGSKGDAEDCAYGSIVDALRETIGPERHAALMRVVEDSPGHSAASLRVPPLPDDAMDVLINAMGTPEDHDRRMAAWRDAERDAMARVLGRGRGGTDEETVSNAAEDAVDGGYRRRKSARTAAVSDASSSDDIVSHPPTNPTHDDSVTDEEKDEKRAARACFLTEKFRGEEAALAQRADADPESREARMRETRRALPIVKIKDALTEALRTNQVVVVSGGTGSGKSTQCPQYILEDAIANGVGPETRIVVTQPRRIAAVSVAQRVASERGEKAGNSVGFSVRLHGTSPRDEGASVEFVTTGVLLRRLMRDPALRGVSHVMIDEVHERDINTDFLLVLLRALLRRRPELRVVLMSATLDAESFSAYFARSTDLKGVEGLEFDSGGESVLDSGSASSAAPPPAPLLSVPTKPRHPVEMLYLEHLAGEADEDEDAVAADDGASSSQNPSSSAAMEGIGAKLASALLEAQDELLERELEEAVAEERAADAFDSEACADGDAEACDLSGDLSGDSSGDAEETLKEEPHTLTELERLEVEVEGGGPPVKGRVARGRSGRLANRVRTLRRAVEMRRDDDAVVSPGGRAVVSRAARLAVRKQRKGRGGGGGAAGEKREREELVVALAAEVARAVALRETSAGRSGSVLVFLPGWDEIKAIMKTLEALPADERGAMRVIPLHSQVPQEEQQTVFDPAPEGTVKVILSTNIAESSVTIDDVLAVVDSGLVREMSYNPESAMSAMGTVATSRASATQRTGRAGRVAPGVCYRLYSRAMFEAMPERPTPEIQRTALEATCLQTCSMTTKGVQNFLSEAMDPPAEETVRLAMERLVTLGAIAEVAPEDDSDDVEVLTPLGSLLSQLPLDPATGRMLVTGVVTKCLDPTLTAAACMSSRDPFIVPTGMRDEAQRARRAFCERSDHLAVLRAYQEWRAIIAEEGMDSACRWARDNFLSVQGLQTLTSLRAQLLNELTRTGLVAASDLGYGGGRNRELKADAEVNQHSGNEPLIVAVLLTGLPGNLASRRAQAHFGVMRTRVEDNAGLHPGCVAFARAPPKRRSEWAALPQWFLYKEMVLSSQVFLRDCSAVMPEQVLLFGGSRVTDVAREEPNAASEEREDAAASAERLLEDAANEASPTPTPLLGADGRLATAPVSETDTTKSNTGSIAALLDRWIVISSSCADTSELLLDVRRELDAALSFKVMRPRRALPKASSEIIDAVAATMHIVDARESAALARQRRAESASGTYDRFSNRDGFGDGTFGSRPNRPGFDRPNRPGFGKPRGRAAGRLRRDADGNFVRTPAKGGEQ